MPLNPSQSFCEVLISLQSLCYPVYECCGAVLILNYADLSQTLAEATGPFTWASVSHAVSVYKVTTFLEFLETWKCQGIRLRSWEKSGKIPKIRERSGNLCSQGNWIVAAQQNNLPILYSYHNSFFVRDTHWEFGLMNVLLFDIGYCLQFRLEKSGIFFCLESGNPMFTSLVLNETAWWQRHACMTGFSVAVNTRQWMIPGPTACQPGALTPTPSGNVLNWSFVDSCSGKTGEVKGRSAVQYGWPAVQSTRRGQPERDHCYVGQFAFVRIFLCLSTAPKTSDAAIHDPAGQAPTFFWSYREGRQQNGSYTCSLIHYFWTVTRLETTTLASYDWTGLAAA